MVSYLKKCRYNNVASDESLHRMILLVVASCMGMIAAVEFTEERK